jgi:hypothetical protein
MHSNDTAVFPKVFLLLQDIQAGNRKKNYQTRPKKIEKMSAPLCCFWFNMSKIVSDELRKMLGKYDTFTVLEVREKVTNDFMFLFESSTKTGYHFVFCPFGIL